MSGERPRYRGMIPEWMVAQRRWREEMQVLPPVSGEDDSTTEEEEEEEEVVEEEVMEEVVEEEEEVPVEREDQCKKKLEEAKALIREQNDEIAALQGQVDRLQAQADNFRAEAIRRGRLAFDRQVTIGARDRLNIDLGEALEQRRRNCRCQGLGPRIRRRGCVPAAQPAGRAPRRARTPPAPMQRRIGRVAKSGVRRPYPK